MKKILNYAKDSRGSALVVVFMAIVVLLVLGMGLMALSIGNAKQAVTTDIHEKLYYPAEGATVQGVEHIKQQALQAYDTIREQMLNGTLSNNNAAYFFGLINSGFTPTPPDKDTGSAISSLSSVITPSEIIMSGLNGERTYSIVSTSQGESLQRQVKGSITVKFVPLEPKFSPFGDKALVVGHQLLLKDVKQNTFLASPDGIETPYVDEPGQIASGTQLYPPPPDRNLNWVLTFGSFTTTINGIVNNCVPAEYGNGSNKFFGFNDQTFNNMLFKGDAGRTYKLNDVNVNTGTIVSYGDLWIIGDSKSSTLENVLIICSGNLHIDGCTIKQASVFVGGTLYVRAGNAKETRVENSIVYTNYVDVGENGNGKSEFVSGLLYAYNNIKVDGNKYGGFQGQVVSRLDTALSNEIPNKIAMFDYDENILKNLPGMLQAMGAAPFIEALKTLNGGSMYTVNLKPNNVIFPSGTKGSIRED